ncbi:MAG: hemolysin III family protein [Deltaproteobacteria bacterium]|nr:hemolysin III family protein [Deltaproteobacteria bacterium]
MEPNRRVKPSLRGHFHQESFFIAIGACAVLIATTPSSQKLIAALIYSASLVSLLGISALYHRPQWGDRARVWMRRLDHAAIFILIAGTFTPIGMLALPETTGNKLLWIIWLFAVFGVLKSLFWVQSPKWFTAILCVVMGWVAFPYLPQLSSQLGADSVALIYLGGIIYTLGAVVYALKRPNPYPAVFWYHEIFHLMVAVAAACHFIVIFRLVG